MVKTIEIDAMSPGTHFLSPPNPSPAVAHMAEETPVLRLALWTASRRGRTEEVRQLVAGEIDIEERGGPAKSTSLHEAAAGGHEQIARLLLDHQADVSSKAKDGATALFWAVFVGHETVARLLIENQADVSAKGNDGRTPLHFAALGGDDTAVARLLIEHQADVSAKGNTGGTALHTAAYRGHETVARLLIEHQADVSSKAKDGETALGWSTDNNDGWTALHAAANGGHETVVRLLLDTGADEKTQATDGRTPEDLATAQEHHQVAAMLKAEGARRALCVAFAMGHHERLGEGTPVQELDAGVVRMVLEQV